MNGGHAARELACQVAGAEVDIEQCALQAAMSSEAGDLVDVPAGAGEIGETEVAEAVRRQFRHTSAQAERAHDLRPTPPADRRCAVAGRCREEQWPASR